MEAYSIHWHPHRPKNQDPLAPGLLPELHAAPAIDIGVTILIKSERDMRIQLQAGMPHALSLVAALRVPLPMLSGPRRRRCSRWTRYPPSPKL